MTIFRRSIRPSAALFHSRSSTCKIFNMIRQDKWLNAWLNAWLLMAGMEMSDKSSFVRYGYSVDLDRFERFGRSGTRRVSQPLACWRKTIERFRSEGRPWRLIPPPSLLARGSPVYMGLKDGSQSSYTISTKNGIRHKKNVGTRKALVVYIC
jgi:hypothetical protein